MKTIDTIRRAARSLTQAKTRTILTSISIGVGAFAIMLSLAAGSGGRQYIANLISANTDVHEIRVMHQVETRFSGNPAPQEYQPNQSSQSVGNGVTLKQLTQADIDAIQHISGVASVEPVYNFTVQYVTRGDGQKKYVASVTSFNKSVTQDYLAGGDSTLGADGILIPESYRVALGFANNQAAIGQTVDLVIDQAATQYSSRQAVATFTQKIVGVYKTSALSVSGNSTLQVLPSTAQQMYDFNTAGLPTHGSYMAAFVHADPSANVDVIKKALTDKGYDAQTAKDILSTLFNFIGVLQGILLGFGALAVLTAVFGIINTQYISVLERTQQIGLMKALGMRRRDVGRLFKFEAAWIGFLGGAIGSIVAAIGGTIANPYIDKALSLEAGTNLLIFTPLSFVIVIGGLMLIAVLAGILPSRKAAKLDPIEALRTE